MADNKFAKLNVTCFNLSYTIRKDKVKVAALLHIFRVCWLSLPGNVADRPALIG